MKNDDATMKCSAKFSPQAIAVFLLSTWIAPVVAEETAKEIPLYPGAAPGSEKWDWSERAVTTQTGLPMVQDVVRPVLLHYGAGEIKDVPSPAPPLFLAVAADDALASGRTVELFTAYRRANGRTELHVFQMGAHGFVNKGGGVRRWQMTARAGERGTAQNAHQIVGQLAHTCSGSTQHRGGWPACFASATSARPSRTSCSPLVADENRVGETAGNRGA
jgi:hypothetical protein